MATNRMISRDSDLDEQKEIKVSDIVQYFQCNICIGTFDGTAITPCGHRFCMHCISNCLERSPDCPNCKRPISLTGVVKDYQFDDLISAIRQKSTLIVEPSLDDKTENQNEDSTGKYKVFLDHLSTKDDRLNEMTERLIQVKEDEISTLKDEIENLQRDLNIKANEILDIKKDLKEEIENKKGEIKRLEELQKKNNMTFKTTIEKLQQEKENSANLFKAQQKQYRRTELDLSQKMGALQTTNWSLQEVIVTKNNEAHQSREQFAQDMNMQREQAAQTLREVKAEWAKETQERITMVNQIHEAQLREKDREIENIRRQLVSHDDQADDLQQSTIAYKKLVRELSELRDKLQFVQRQNNHLQTELYHARSRSN